MLESNSIFIDTILSFVNIDPKSKLILSDCLRGLVEIMATGHSGLILEDYLLKHNLTNDDDISLINLIQILKKSNICDFHSANTIKYKHILILVELKHDKSTILYFNRYYNYEINIAQKIQQLILPSQLSYNEIKTTIDRLQLPEDFPNQEQINAILAIAMNKLAIITGGPGTGKTTTIFVLIIVLLRLYNSELRIAIIAPTGKAVNRANESVINSLNLFLNKIVIKDDEKSNINQIDYKTIHKLLGHTNLANTFKYNQNNYLDYDVIIVDESSMVSLSLYNSLLNAINPHRIKHLIFLGDKNQLSSVEEGYVFADLITYYEIISQNSILPTINVNYLTTSNRNIGDVALFAKAILEEDITTVQHIINNSQYIKQKDNQLNLILTDLLSPSYHLSKYIELIQQGADFSQLATSLKQFIILCDKNIGVLGVDNINKILDNYICDELNCQDTWYHGRAIIILENNSALDLVNGDIGICLHDGDSYKVQFSNGKTIVPQLLPKHSLAYAITIHKSQGSEYDNVIMILGDSNKNSLTKEIIYTGITREKNSIILYAKHDCLTNAIYNKSNRYSGLNYFLQLS
jgi:exodeoxyribonuclease V alpha subunit